MLPSDLPAVYNRSIKHTVCRKCLCLILMLNDVCFNLGFTLKSENVLQAVEVT